MVSQEEGKNEFELFLDNQILEPSTPRRTEYKAPSGSPINVTGSCHSRKFSVFETYRTAHDGISPSFSKPDNERVLRRRCNTIADDKYAASSWASSFSESADFSMLQHNYISLPQSPNTSFLSKLDRNFEAIKFREGESIGSYRIGKALGFGTFSECRMGWTVGDSESEDVRDPVAFKILRRSECRDAEVIEHFQHEIHVWKFLDHPHIIPLLDAFCINDTLVAVMPLAENGTLLNHIKKHKKLEPNEAKRIIKQVASAVAYLHLEKRIAHRDIKLDNILLDESFNAYLCDFGLCDCIGRTCEFLVCGKNEDQMSLGKGSIHYLSPEGIRACPPSSRMSLSELASYEMEPIDHGTMLLKSDIWALGVVLYAMVKGSLPFDDDYMPRLQISILKGEYEKLSEDYDPLLRELLDGLLNSNVHDRLLIDQVLRHSWFHA